MNSLNFNGHIHNSECALNYEKVNQALCNLKALDNPRWESMVKEFEDEMEQILNKCKCKEKIRELQLIKELEIINNYRYNRKFF
jgi:hypothetical protein